MSASARSPAGAGRFYPSDPAQLRAEIRRYLDDAEPMPLDGPLIGVVVPHAGIMYSGPVAAFGYRALATQEWDAVVLMGGSHHFALPAAHVYAHGTWASPLGDFPIAEDVAAELVAAHELIVDDPLPHETEHSLEVQLPFLAETLGQVPIVPVLVSPAEPEACAALGEALGRVGAHRKLAIVASTDLSHYRPYDEAVTHDHKTIDAICAWKPLALAHESVEKHVELCGGGAVAAAEVAAGRCGATHATLLRYANSGDVVDGPKDHVVGYAAIALLGDAETVPRLTRDERTRLLTLARETLDAFVLGQPPPPLPDDDRRLCVLQGVFVTLRTHGTTLRGCLGRTSAPQPIAEGVQWFTEAAAARDPRFPPVQPGELADLHIELSALSPVEPLADPESIVIGRDGLFLTRGKNAGLLLPQVASTQGWNREQFLQGVSRKAGLPADAWEWDDTRLYRFTADVFGEERRSGGRAGPDRV